MAEKKKIRKVRFGLRLKVSIVIIASITLSSALLGIAVYNQYNRKIKQTMISFSGTILGGAYDDMYSYLKYKRAVDTGDRGSRRGYRPGPGVYNALKKHRESIEAYFNSVLKREPMLDIAFLIDVNWDNIDFQWDRTSNAHYSYFRRADGNLESYPLYSRDGKPLPGTYGRDDAQLKPTVLKHFMNNIQLSPYMAFSEGRKEGEEEFVVVAVPIMKTGGSEQLYRDYADYIREKPATEKEFAKRAITGASFKSAFMRELIGSGIYPDYEIKFDKEADVNYLARYIYSMLEGWRLPYSGRRPFLEDLSAILKTYRGNDDILSFSELSSAAEAVSRRYGLKPLDREKAPAAWLGFYRFVERKGFEINPLVPLDRLSVLSFRKDLAGIAGVFISRSEYHREMKENRDELINLIISILLRVTVISLLFPGFIIRSVEILGDGAYQIGRGNLSQRIMLNGSDELCRLSDIFNMMASNLQKAQSEMLEKKRMADELKTAEEIQSALLPGSLPESASAEFGAYYSAQSEAGGDYYDVIELDDGRYAICIADVSGHGVASGLVMAMTRTLLHIYCGKTGSTKKVLEQINTYLKENTASNYFVTMFYGIFSPETGKLTYTSAGHCEGIILREGKVRTLPGGGIALGAAGTDLFSSLAAINEVTLKKGDYIVLHTDGVDEARNKHGEEYGLERFYASLTANYGCSPHELTDLAVKDLDNFTGDIPRKDDVTLLIARLK